MRYLAAVAVLALAPSAFAELIANGSFESPTVSGGFAPQFENFNGGSSIGAWTVGGNSVEVIGTYWNAFDGSQSLDLSGGNAGSITQTINTTAGASYVLSFYMSGNPDGGNAVKNMDVTVGASTTSFSYNTTTFSPTSGAGGNMQWQLQTLTFTATGATTQITFTSQEANAYGPALDLISVVPEPSTISLFGLGIAAAGATIWRRRRRAPAKA